MEFGRKQTATELLNSLVGMDAMRCEVAVMHEYGTSLKWLVNSGWWLFEYRNNTSCIVNATTMRLDHHVMVTLHVHSGYANKLFVVFGNLQNSYSHIRINPVLIGAQPLDSCFSSYSSLWFPLLKFVDRSSTSSKQQPAAAIGFFTGGSIPYPVINYTVYSTTVPGYTPPRYFPYI